MELMVVVVIVGLLGSVVLLTAPTAGSGLRRDTDALAAQLARARDEAILSTRTVRADIDARGYRFAITRRDGWQPLTGAGFAPETWTSGISPALPRDAQTLSIAFDPLGAAQPAELALSDGRDVAHLSVGPDGRVHVSGTR
ncbi:type II secretion system protein GspH [Lysobacteraceae bacterium NML91-0213]|nr:type II secretion system protein GspH [Xanthomonadaceae bacterium NML91-0213]